MSTLAKKTGKKVWLSNKKSWLDKYSIAQTEGAGVDWALVQTHLALQSEQVIKKAITHWGNCRWHERWSHLSTCRQAKLWFPVPWGDFSPLIRRLHRNELGRFIHFTTGHNHLLHHKRLLEGGGDDKCRLCGVDREDAVHLWANCVATQSLRVEDPASGFYTATGPVTWSFHQLSRFLKEPLIVELLDQVGIEHSGTTHCSGRVDRVLY